MTISKRNKLQYKKKTKKIKRGGFFGKLPRSQKLKQEQPIQEELPLHKT